MEEFRILQQHQHCKLQQLIKQITATTTTIIKTADHKGIHQDMNKKYNLIQIKLIEEQLQRIDWVDQITRLRVNNHIAYKFNVQKITNVKGPLHHKFILFIKLSIKIFVLTVYSNFVNNSKSQLNVFHTLSIIPQNPSLATHGTNRVITFTNIKYQDRQCRGQHSQLNQQRKERIQRKREEKKRKTNNIVKKQLTISKQQYNVVGQQVKSQQNQQNNKMSTQQSRLFKGLAQSSGLIEPAKSGFLQTLTLIPPTPSMKSIKRQILKLIQQWNQNTLLCSAALKECYCDLINYMSLTDPNSSNNPGKYQTIDVLILLASLLSRNFIQILLNLTRKTDQKKNIQIINTNKGYEFASQILKAVFSSKNISHTNPTKKFINFNLGNSSDSVENNINGKRKNRNNSIVLHQSQIKNHPKAPNLSSLLSFKELPPNSNQQKKYNNQIRYRKSSEEQEKYIIKRCSSKYKKSEQTNKTNASSKSVYEKLQQSCEQEGILLVQQYCYIILTYQTTGNLISPSSFFYLKNKYIKDIKISSKSLKKEGIIQSNVRQAEVNLQNIKVGYPKYPVSLKNIQPLVSKKNIQQQIKPNGKHNYFSFIKNRQRSDSIMTNKGQWIKQKLQNMRPQNGKINCIDRRSYTICHKNSLLNQNIVNSRGVNSIKNIKNEGVMKYRNSIIDKNINKSFKKIDDSKVISRNSPSQKRNNKENITVQSFMKSAFKVFEHYDHNYEPKFDKKYDQISAEVNFLQQSTSNKKELSLDQKNTPLQVKNNQYINKKQQDKSIQIWGRPQKITCSHLSKAFTYHYSIDQKSKDLQAQKRSKRKSEYQGSQIMFQSKNKHKYWKQNKSISKPIFHIKSKSISDQCVNTQHKQRKVDWTLVLHQLKKNITRGGGYIEKFYKVGADCGELNNSENQKYLPILINKNKQNIMCNQIIRSNQHIKNKGSNLINKSLSYHLPSVSRNQNQCSPMRNKSTNFINQNQGENREECTNINNLIQVHTMDSVKYQGDNQAIFYNNKIHNRHEPDDTHGHFASKLKKKTMDIKKYKRQFEFKCKQRKSILEKAIYATIAD